jgi:hypothetical protein
MWVSFGAVGSMVVAVVALVFSIHESRAHRRWADQNEQEQRRWADQNARDNVKPFFWTKLQTYVDLKSISLRNDGVGPAIITNATFTKNGRSTSRLVELFDLDIPFWETYIGISPGRVVPPQGEIVLLRQSLQHLEGQGIDRAKGLAILKSLQAQRKAIHLKIEFEDIYGKAMPAYERDL